MSRWKKEIRTLIFGALFCVPLSLCAAAEAIEFQPVVVRPGDTLWGISHKYLKDPTKWNVIVRHNRLPTADPTVALPGMTLRIPMDLIKAELRAATLVHAVRKVLSRKKGRPDWKKTTKGRLLYHGDGLRTMDKSWARVKFFGGHLLSIDPNSMTILKSPKKSDHDLFLKRGGIHATIARVVTPSARITPRKNTKYTAFVFDDLRTRVQVYKGSADVVDLKGTVTVNVKAGHYTEVAPGRTPRVPVKIPNFNAQLGAEIGAVREGQVESLVQVRRLGGALPGAGIRGGRVGTGQGLLADLQKLSVGMPVAAYHIQVSRTKGFGRIVFDQNFDAYEAIDLRRAGLGDGLYWVRVSIVDLLGEKGAFSSPRPYRVGEKASEFSGSTEFRSNLDVLRPEKNGLRVRFPRYRIIGKADPELEVRINGKRTPMDEDGYFRVEVRLKRGPNTFRFTAVDLRGNESVLERTVDFNP